MELNLMFGARPDEVFYLAPASPNPLGLRVTHPWWGFGLMRRVRWTDLILPNGRPDGWFTSWTMRIWRTVGDHFWCIQFYHGNTKIDGGRTFALRYGQLGGTTEENLGYVMTQTPKEMLALRFKHVDAVPIWTNMGGG